MLNNLLKILKNNIIVLLVLILSATVLAFSIRGNNGNPSAKELNTGYWKEDGPFELSPERGRFAIIYSFVEDNSFFYSIPVAQFAAPDLGYKNNKYVSLFAPGVSFITMPGYIIGTYFGAAQVGTFAVIALFALINMFLIQRIAIKLGANNIAAIIGSLLFLFASPAFAYAVTLYQHHISTFLILFSIYILLKYDNVWALCIVFFLCAAAIPIDYPNLFLMFPIGITAVWRIISFYKKDSKLTISLKPFRIPALFIMAIPVALFMLFNYLSYDNPLQLSGTVPSAPVVTDEGQALAPDHDAAKNLTEAYVEVESKNKSAVGFFKTRNILSGLYIHTISPDRGIAYYTPVMLLGIIGFIIAFKKKLKFTSLFFAVLFANILLYSMWGDPWGGWAFGSRYLIPTYAILSIFIAILLTEWRSKIFAVIFCLLAIYSIGVNTLGAITTSAIPPKVQVLYLEEISGTIQRYTYRRNWEFLTNGSTKSFMYSEYLSKSLTTVEFYITLSSVISLMLIVLVTYNVVLKKKGADHV